jgi:hypothetical protein
VSVHEQMNDDEVLSVVAGLLSALPVPGPPDAKAIMARGRTRRHRRRPGIGLAASAAAQHELRAAARARRARWLLTWQGPVAGVAVVLLVAAALVGLKSLRNDRADPVASPGPIAGPPLPAGAIPRYYVALDLVQGTPGWSITAGDGQAGKVIASFPLPKGDVLSGGAVAGAADDRTFVVTGAFGRPPAVREGHKTVVQPGKTVFGPAMWYLTRISPGSADPLRVTRLPIQAPADGQVREMALSGDGTELAVVSVSGKSSIALRTYSVATGRLQHSWSATISFSPSAGVRSPVTDLSWVGDNTVGFAVIYTPQVREEVRTLSISAPGNGLLAESHVVWSQYVPPPPRDVYQEGTPRACDTPFLSGNGQVVACGTSAYSASDKRLSAVWLAYPVAAPARARVIGSILQPKDVSSLNGPVSVEWTNASGTEVIGQWNPTVVTFPGTSHSIWTTTNYVGIIGRGTVRPFTAFTNHVPPHVAW